MLAVYLSPIYLLLNIYIVRWLLKWMGACTHHFNKKWVRAAVIAIYLFFATSMVVGFFMPQGKGERFMKLVGNYWLGVLIYILVVVITADIIRWILKHNKRVNQEKLASKKLFVLNGTLCIILIAAITIGGVVNARYIHTTDYEITVNKDAGTLKELHIVLVADLHMGYNIGSSHIEQMVQRINAQNPDVVVIAGDIFDNEYAALDNPDKLEKSLKSIKSKYGVYAVYGNHDIEEKILAGFTFGSKDKKKMSHIKMDQLLEHANVKLLRDEAVLVDQSFYLYGRPDYERLGRGISKRKSAEEITADLDQSKPIITIDHEPRELDELSKAGVDIDLCGHTHDGQIFPLNLTSKIIWENSYGYLKKGNMHNIVTSGVGLYGPNMRVATIAEICDIQVNFQ